MRFNSLNPKTRNRIHKDFILTQDGEQFVPEYVVQAISGIDKHFVPKADPWELNVLGDRRHTHPAYDGHIATESLRRRKWRGGLTARLAGKYRTPRK